jgi:hypothetical protein
MPAKPILVVKHTHKITSEQLDKMRANIRASGIDDDYYVFFVPSESKFVEFEVHSENNAVKLDYVNLDKMVEELEYDN